MDSPMDDELRSQSDAKESAPLPWTPPPPPPLAPPVRPRTNGLAPASLVMGLVALMIFPLIPLSAVGGFLALVTGAVSRRQIDNSNKSMAGIEMARFGLWLGVIALLVALGLTIAAFVFDIEVVTINLSD
jgi:Domain of unknown function (DUF4190)